MARGPTQYEIVTSETSTEDLAEKVNQKIRQGWEPIGGASAGMGQYFQSMTKLGQQLHDPR